MMSVCPWQRGFFPRLVLMRHFKLCMITTFTEVHASMAVRVADTVSKSQESQKDRT